MKEQTNTALKKEHKQWLAADLRLNRRTGPFLIMAETREEARQSFKASRGLADHQIAVVAAHANEGDVHDQFS